MEDYYVKDALLATNTALKGPFSAKYEKLAAIEEILAFEQWGDLKSFFFVTLPALLGLLFSWMIAGMFPPSFLSLYFDNGVTRSYIIVLVLYMLVVALIYLVAATGVFFALEGMKTAFIIRKGRKLDKELIAWANRQTTFSFGFPAQSREYLFTTGYWQGSVFSVTDNGFYEKARSAFCNLLETIPGLVTQEAVEQLILENIEQAKHTDDIDRLVLLYYYQEIGSFERIKRELA